MVNKIKKCEKLDLSSHSSCKIWIVKIFQKKAGSW